MCVHAYMRGCVCACVCIRVCVYACVFVCGCVHAHVRVYVRACVCTSAIVCLFLWVDCVLCCLQGGRMPGLRRFLFLWGRCGRRGLRSVLEAFATLLVCLIWKAGSLSFGESREPI